MPTITSRDMSQKEFDAACKQYGFEDTGGAMGYFRLAPPHQNVHTSVWNAGPTRRQQLAYLLAEQARCEKNAEAE